MTPDDDVEIIPVDHSDNDVEIVSMDQGPPSIPEEFHPGRGESVALGWTSGIPFAQDASAAIRSGIDSIGTRKKLLDDYRMQRDRIKGMDEAAARDHPGYYYSANIPANVATAIAAGEMVPAKIAGAFAKGRALPVMGRILGNAGLSAAQEASQGTLDAEHVGKDVLAAEGANLMLRGVLKPLSGVAKGAQLPQKVADAVYGRLGSSRLGKWLGEGGEEVSDAMSSARVNDLKATRAAGGDFSNPDVQGTSTEARLARSAQKGEADIGPEGFTVPAKEFADDIADASRKAKDEAVRMHAPDRVLDKDPVVKMQGEAGFIRESLAKRKAELEDLQSKHGDDSQDVGMWNFGHTGKTDVGTVPQPPLSRNVGASDPETGSLTRNTATKAESKKRWGDSDKPEGWDERWKKNPSEDMVGDRLRAEYQRKHAHESNAEYVPPKGKPETPKTESDAALLDEAAAKISQRTKENREVDFDSLMAKARKLRDESDLKGAAKAADEKIKSNTAGRKTVERLGTGAAAVGGFMKGGPVGGFAGAAGGGKVTRAVMGTIDAAGAAGQKLAKVKSWAEKLAAKGGPMGRLAQAALDGKGDGLIQRLAVLADIPEDDLRQ